MYIGGREREVGQSGGDSILHTLSGCNIKRRQGHLGDRSDSLWLQEPRGGV